MIVKKSIGLSNFNNTEDFELHRSGLEILAVMIARVHKQRRINNRKHNSNAADTKPRSAGQRKSPRTKVKHLKKDSQGESLS